MDKLSVKAVLVIGFIIFLTILRFQYDLSLYSKSVKYQYYVKSIETKTFNDINNNLHYTVNGPNCRILNVSAYHDSLKGIIGPYNATSCSDKRMLTRLVYDDSRGEVRLDVVKEAIHDYFISNTVTLKCCYQVITREWQDQPISMEDDNRYNLSLSKCFLNFTVLPKDAEFFYVFCQDLEKQDSNLYQTIHAKVVEKKVEMKVKKNVNIYSVLLLGIDSISRLNFERTMPRTKEFIEQMGWPHFEGYNKMGVNTFPNLASAILTGRTREQIESLCFANNSVPLDYCPFIWKNFSDMGYLTAYIEDEVSIGTFNYEKRGFINSPTDYYMRPLLVHAKKMLPIKSDGGMDFCYGNQIQAEYLLDYSTHFIKRMQNRTYFKLLWFNSFSHNELKQPQALDDRFRKFIEDIQPHLNRTFVIFLSDHGVRFGPVRETFIGWLEERLPFIYFWIPSSFKQKYPQKYTNLLANKNRLTTPYDVYATLQEFLYGKVVEPPVACPNCHSLFEVASLSRSCEDVGIPEQFCTCIDELNDQQALVTDPIVISTVEKIIKMMNDFIKTKTNAIKEGYVCASLSLGMILSVRATVQQKLIFTNIMKYTVLFQVTPSHGRFEIMWSSNSLVDLKDLSRINSYEGQTDCILGNDYLKNMCFCVELDD